MNIVAKKIGAAIVDIIIVVLVLLSIIISISSFTAKSNDGVPDLFGYSPFTVQTDSMKPTLSKGDYIFVEKCDTENLQVGDIITYHTIIQGQRAINTHRIVDVIVSDGSIEYQTQGDNKVTNPEPDETLVHPMDIIGKYNDMKISGFGTVIDFLSTKWGFFLVILLPVLLFTVFQVYKLVTVVMYNKKVDMLNAVKENASDEVKEAIIAEYLAKQKEEVVKEDTSD